MKLGYDKDKLREVCGKYELSLVVLHGSYIKGVATGQSDVDVALLGNPRIIKEKYFDIIRDFSSVFGDKFDPVFLNGAEAMITYQVAMNGKPLYEKVVGAFNAFKIYAISRYMDTKKFRLLEKKYIDSAIKEIGKND
jgi:predicted nucleotidyltransferase